MEPLFINTHTRTAQLYRELQFYYAYLRPLSLTLHLLMLAELLLSTVLLLCHKTDSVTAIVLPLAFEAFVLLLTVVRIKTAAARQQELSQNSTIIYTTAVFPNLIRQESSVGGKAEFRFEQFKKVIETRHYIFFCTKTNMAFIFSKNGFTEGDLPAFRQFLRSVGLKIKQ